MLWMWSLRLLRFVFDKDSGQRYIGSLPCTCQAVDITLKYSSHPISSPLMVPTHGASVNRSSPGSRGQKRVTSRKLSIPGL